MQLYYLVVSDARIALLFADSTPIHDLPTASSHQFLLQHCKRYSLNETSSLDWNRSPVLLLNIRGGGNAITIPCIGFSTEAERVNATFRCQRTILRAEAWCKVPKERVVVVCRSAGTGICRSTSTVLRLCLATRASYRWPGLATRVGWSRLGGGRCQWSTSSGRSTVGSTCYGRASDGSRGDSSDRRSSDRVDRTRSRRRHGVLVTHTR